MLSNVEVFLKNLCYLGFKINRYNVNLNIPFKVSDLSVNLVSNLFHITQKNFLWKMLPFRDSLLKIKIILKETHHSPPHS